LPEDDVRKLADGRVYTGLDAKKLHLVDEVGYLEDAIHAAMDMAGIADARVVVFDRGDGFHGSIYAGMPKIPSKIDVKLDLPGLNPTAGATFMYLWEPGAPH